MIGALDDVVVLDLTTTFWGSMGAALLGDFGAAVVRVEHPDPRQRRFVDVDVDDEHEPGTWNYRFDLANRNKRSVAIDVESEAGGEIVRALAAKADVVVTDRSHDWLASRKLDYTSASAARSDVVYVRGSTLGPQGTEEPPLDEIAAARTGMMPILPQPGEPPVYPGHGQMYTAVMIAFGATAALLHRRATGEGQQVDTSLLAGNMYGASLDLQAFLAIGGERFLHPVSRLDAGNPMSGTQYPTSDGLWVTLTMPDTDRWWPVLAEIAGLDAADPRFEDHDNRCGEHRLVLMEILDQAFRKHPADHWRAIFNERQISADVIETYDYPVADPVTRENRYILDLDDPSLGPTSSLGFPIYMTDTPAWLDRTAARLGQHSAEVLRELLEYSPARITELIARGVVA